MEEYQEEGLSDFRNEDVLIYQIFQLEEILRDHSNVDTLYN
jgi:hypothetical protein